MADPTSTGLPESIEAAWGLRSRPSRGPKRALSVDRIVAAGIAVADAEGLDALSMSRVASEIGSSAMSLYRYISAKDELLTLMVDAGYPPPPAPDPDNWRSGLEQWAKAEFMALLARPWLVRVPISGPPVTPNQLRWLESGLQSLSKTGLAANEKMSVLLLLSGFSRNVGTLVADIMATGKADMMPAYGATLKLLINPHDFPELTSILDTPPLNESDDIDTEFLFGLTRILDGTAALIRGSGEEPPE